ncbi:unnamed protein product [Rotaria magnacalcarata]
MAYCSITDNDGDEETYDDQHKQEHVMTALNTDIKQLEQVQTHMINEFNVIETEQNRVPKEIEQNVTCLVELLDLMQRQEDELVQLDLRLEGVYNQGG